jgi:putative endonuclease
MVLLNADRIIRCVQNLRLILNSIKFTNVKFMKGYMYILECADESYYTGSTIDLERRLSQHQNGEGANHTKKRLPVKLVYFEEFDRIDKAFYREKQVQGWSRKKKQALIQRQYEKLPGLAMSYSTLPSTGSGNVSTGSGNVSIGSGNVSIGSGNVSIGSGNVSTGSGNVSTGSGNEGG